MAVLKQKIDGDWFIQGPAYGGASMCTYQVSTDALARYKGYWAMPDMRKSELCYPSAGRFRRCSGDDCGDALQKTAAIKEEDRKSTRLNSSH